MAVADDFFAVLIGGMCSYALGPLFLIPRVAHEAFQSESPGRVVTISVVLPGLIELGADYLIFSESDGGRDDSRELAVAIASEASERMLVDSEMARSSPVHKALVSYPGTANIDCCEFGRGFLSSRLVGKERNIQVVRPPKWRPDFAAGETFPWVTNEELRGDAFIGTLLGDDFSLAQKEWAVYCLRRKLNDWSSTGFFKGTILGRACLWDKYRKKGFFDSESATNRVVQMLLRYGADPNASCGLRDDLTVLGSAVAHGQLLFARSMIEAGGDISAKPPCGGSRSVLDILEEKSFWARRSLCARLGI